MVDLGLHPVPPGEGLRLLGAGAAEPILLARVTLDHLAAVSGDCPYCGGPLRFDPARDAAICPRGRAAFRLDGLPSEGPRELRLRSYVCHRAGMRVEVEAKPLGGAGDGPP